MARPLAVGLVAFDRLTALDLTGPMDVFAAANDVAGGRYELRVLGIAGAGRVVAESGLAIETQGGLRDAGRLDTIVVPGGSGLREPAVNAAVAAELRRRAPRTRRVASVCTGIYGLAATGLLDGRRATTHWRFARDVAARFPRVALDPDAIYVRDGRFFTSAGVTAGIDLALAMVEGDLGRAAALAVARELVVFLKRQGGQSQYSAPLRFQAQTKDATRDLGAWIADHLADDLSLERLAARAHLSGRQLGRRFVATYGVTPAAYVQEVRLEAARTMLLELSASIAQVAEATGFGSADALSRAFERRFGVRPSDFRSRFAQLQ